MRIFLALDFDAVYLYHFLLQRVIFNYNSARKSSAKKKLVFKFEKQNLGGTENVIFLLYVTIN